MFKQILLPKIKTDLVQQSLDWAKTAFVNMKIVMNPLSVPRPTHRAETEGT